MHKYFKLRMRRLCKLHTTKRQCNIKYCNNLKKQKYSRSKQYNTNHCDKVKEQKKTQVFQYTLQGTSISRYFTRYARKGCAQLLKNDTITYFIFTI